MKSAAKAVTPNRREDQRSPYIVLEFKGRHKNKVFMAYTENISKGGFFASLSQSLKVGDRFPIEFVLPDRKTTVRCMCKVAWKKRYDTMGIVSEGVGVQFVDLGEAERNCITQWIEKGEKERRHLQK